ncbi:mitochondrial fission ELM1 family protein [Pseudomonadota bacterium]
MFHIGKTKNIWVLTDDRIGTSSQSTGLADNLTKLGNYNIITKNIKYNSFVKLPNCIRRSSLIGVKIGESDLLNPLNKNEKQPDIIICAGRRLAPVALYIKKRLESKVSIIHITNPHLSFRKFDFVIIPKHDGFKDAKNIITTYGAINKINKETIEEESKKWKKELSKYANPKIAIILGGNTKSTKFLPESFEKLGKVVSDIAQYMGGSLLITTSRRTDPECISALERSVKVENYFYNWVEESKKSHTDNPYFAYIGLADYVVATGDSMSMLSEICSTGKPLYIYYGKNEIPSKHLRFCKSLINSGYAKKLELNSNIKLTKYKYKPLNEVERVAKLIHKSL